MTTNNKQKIDTGYYGPTLVNKSRHFSPRISILIVLNILAFARKVSAINHSS